MKYLLYGNGDFTNRGCEAIANGMCHILHQMDNAEIMLGSYFPELDRLKASGMQAQSVKINRNREGLANILGGTSLKLGFTELSLKIPYSGLKDLARKADIALAVGGDNYCYPGRERYYRMNKTLKKAGKRIVFAGCSIEEKDLDGTMLEDLRQFDAVLPRERYTLELLQNKGLSNLRQCSDPAFVMPADESKVPSFVRENPCVGVNISPLTFSYSDQGKKAWDAVISLIRWILDETQYTVLLIPHVYGEGNDPFINEKIKNNFPNEARVRLLTEELTAPQLKGVIASCKALICARTHASIAGYSSMVPTFVLGYSCKARGIAMDLFGKTEGYIFPVQELGSKTGLFEQQIRDFLKNIEPVKARLMEVIPGYTMQAYAIRDVLEGLGI
ncbi:MAG: polysaccharide pyruvyl transferase family protein [Candidatus Limivicinus sp.]|nr:polysaccharide pyruvyl transferase family protein [Candidatus Limivicinus sp.]